MRHRRPRTVVGVMSDAHVNGVRIRYRSEGIDGPPLVLLHGRTANHNDWNGITERLATRFRVYVPDLRGHGASDYPGNYPLPEMAEDIVGLLDHLDIGKAAVIGHSLGGMVAYLLAANHQERVEVLVLEDPPPPLPLARPVLVEDDSTGFDWAMMRETERQFVAPDPGWVAGMQRITAPTLVVGGGESSHVRAEQTAALIPGAQLVVIDVGHVIHVAAPKEFLAVVEPFLDSARRPERL